MLFKITVAVFALFFIEDNIYKVLEESVNKASEKFVFLQTQTNTQTGRGALQVQLKKTNVSFLGRRHWAQNQRKNLVIRQDKKLFRFTANKI